MSRQFLFMRWNGNSPTALSFPNLSIKAAKSCTARLPLSAEIYLAKSSASVMAWRGIASSCSSPRIKSAISSVFPSSSLTPADSSTVEEPGLKTRPADPLRERGSSSKLRVFPCLIVKGELLPPPPEVAGLLTASVCLGCGIGWGFWIGDREDCTPVATGVLVLDEALDEDVLTMLRNPTVAIALADITGSRLGVAVENPRQLAPSPTGAGGHGDAEPPFPRSTRLSMASRSRATEGPPRTWTCTFGTGEYSWPDEANFPGDAVLGITV
mmetsp:Transcript_90426/g.161101  ORF Transcript_90426/g.161101 Transcript_90426/m.161101 type:complete len:269 (+) Transcript_90426:1518-2324(+)